MDHTLASTPWHNIEKSEELVYALSVLYIKTKGVSPCCPETLKQFHEEIRNKPKMFDMTQPKRNSVAFQMKEEKLIYVQSWHKHVSTESITDEEAERLIREIPSSINLFDKVPQELLAELGIDTNGDKVPALEDQVQGDATTDTATNRKRKTK